MALTEIGDQSELVSHAQW